MMTIHLDHRLSTGSHQKQLMLQPSRQRHKKLSKAHRQSVLECNTVNGIILRNSAVEERLKDKTDISDLLDSTVAHFLQLTTHNLQDFIRVSKFRDMTFRKVALTGLVLMENLTRHGTNNKQPILLRPIVLKKSRALCGLRGNFSLLPWFCSS